MNRLLKTLVALVLLLIGEQDLNAQNLLTESFNYTKGKTLVESSWSVVNGTETVNPIIIGESNPSSTGTMVSSAGKVVLLQGNGQDVFRSFSPTNQSIYAALVVRVSAAKAVGDFFCSLGTEAAPMGDVGAKIFIRSNGSGFSFGVLRGTGGTPVYETTVRPFGTAVNLILKYEAVAGTTNDRVKLYVNPDVTSEPITASAMYDATIGNDVAELSAVALVQEDVDNAATLTVADIVVGTSWLGVTTTVYANDYGDLPISFENDKDGNFLPAVHAYFKGFSLGKLIDTEAEPASVTAPNENNIAGDNAIGLADEDALTQLKSVTRGVAYTLTVPVSIPADLVGFKYLYGWLDLNGDGKFQAEEVATAIVLNNVSGEYYAQLSWTLAQVNTIAAGTEKIYLRLRLSDRNLYDFTGANGGGLIDERSVGNGATSGTNAANAAMMAFGEVEDYQLAVDMFDFGDAPLSYEVNPAGNSYPARQSVNPLFMIGNAVGEERIAHSVGAGADNNGENGDGLEEDGLMSIPTVTRGAPFSFSVPVQADRAGYIMAWIDFNNNGRFEVGESSFISNNAGVGSYLNVPTGISNATFWFKPSQTRLIPSNVNHLYVRIRLTRVTGNDNNNTNDVDERSIGDGMVFGRYTTASDGEVEDYRFIVGEDLYDFGDTPVSYEMDKDGTANPANFKPARNIPSDQLYLGKTYTVETGAHSVAPGADNNGENGDGNSDDGLSLNQLFIKASDVNSFDVKVHNSTGNNVVLYSWIDFNNNGRFEASEAVVSNVDAGATSVKVSFTAAQMAMVPPGTKHLYMRLRLIQAAPGITVGDLTSGVKADVVDERAIADGVSSGQYVGVSLGEVEDYQLTIIRDYGDVPNSYENGNPASHSNGLIPELTIGKTIDYELTNAAVAPGADNNGENGDGLDEDGIVTSMTITSGSPFTIKVPVNTSLSGLKYLYAWIDFNGDGIFNGNEAVFTSVNVTGGRADFVLTWPATATVASASVLAAGKTYVRFRLSETAIPANANGADLTKIDSRSYGTMNSSGEVEDYQFLVVDQLFDYGDAPDMYNRNRSSESVAPRQTISSLLHIGETIDVEAEPHTVAMGADNNGLNGDGADEDGLQKLVPVYKGVQYNIPVSVLNNTGADKTLYGWIDFNNDGHFQATEVATVIVPTSTNQQKATLVWEAATTGLIPNAITHLYMRLRISEVNLIDFTTGELGALLDERAIGDGLSAGVYGVASAGEVEDYRLEVSKSYDYGDAPDTYDMNKDGALVAARQAISQGLYIGMRSADAEPAKLASADALGDDNHGENDEGGLEIPAIYKDGGTNYTLNVPVTNNTASAKYLYAWIDFNNNGKFEAGEMQRILVDAGTSNSKVQLTWPSSQTTIVGNPSQLFMRLRISDGNMADLITGANAALLDERAIADGLSSGVYGDRAGAGEIEDHAIPVFSELDYGDVPVSYEQNATNQFLPARHLPNSNLILGELIDMEPAPHSVAAGADNNGGNGDGLDEDGVKGMLPVVFPGSEYRVSTTVTNNLTIPATVHGWIDMDGDGRFSVNEYASVVLPANSGKQTISLFWPMMGDGGGGTHMYMRIRVSSASFGDNVSTIGIDERAIGDGLSSGVYGTYPVDGEVEDYQLTIDQTIALPQDCEQTDDRLGRLSPIKALYHGSIVKTANGDFLVFGANAHGAGITQNTPIKVESGSNGFRFAGTPLLVTGFSHQYFLLSTAGLYTWGVARGPSLFGLTGPMIQAALPEGVGPAQIQSMDVGYSSSSVALMLLTKTGEVWVYSNVDKGNVNGNGNQEKMKWHQVMLNETTVLTGMKDVRTSGNVGIATDGNNFYTWGGNVMLGNGEAAVNRAYATKMNPSSGISLPLKQVEISQENSKTASYYLRDAAGKVFVLGGNSRGQLGLGNTNAVNRWSAITHMNEQPDGTSLQTDVTKPIKKVKWISASNSDDAFPHFSLITEEDRNYTVASNSSGNYGSIGGAPKATNIYLPTAVTMNGGKEKMVGKMLYVAAGGHITILVMDKNDRYGYVGHTIEGSDGCGGCTMSPEEFNFKGPPSTGPVCGNTAYDFGDLDDRYNLGDMASHEIKYSQADNPLKLGENAPDSDDGPQFEFTGAENNADGDDFDGKGGLIDEDAFVSGKMPAKTTGSPYTLHIPYTNNTGKVAYLYAFIDWNNNGVFEPGEAIVKEAKPGAKQTVEMTWADIGILPDCNAETVRSFVRLRLTTDRLLDDPNTPEDDRSHVKASDGEVEDYYIDWICEKIEYCYIPGATEGQSLQSFVGISSLGRVGTIDADKWPMVRTGAWLVLESKTKGFVPNRVPFNASGLPVGIPAADFVEGMLVYDVTNNCLKMYTSKDKGGSYGWYKIERQYCPD
ncbi:GEVED domain-containing protein [Sphingobacterium sp. MYb382]|uniref:GEVED domain-containing protein n=1 Tax=Sphingobacterium sp. MYb382 TaxID=2745278 RepID=UPI0030AEF268